MIIVGRQTSAPKNFVKKIFCKIFRRGKVVDEGAAGTEGAPSSGATEFASTRAAARPAGGPSGDQPLLEDLDEEEEEQD